MKKLILIIIVIIALGIIIPIAIIGIDIAMSLNSFNVDDIDVDVGSPTYTFSDDNRTLTYSVDLSIKTTPLGYLPKSILLTLEISDSNGNSISEPLESEFPVGETKNDTLSGEIYLTDYMILTIIGGGSIELTLKGTAGIKYLGIILPLTYYLPEQIIEIP